jgi:SNF family Na+-dependent transporter
MEFIWTTAIGAVIGWIVKVILDKLTALWRRRRAALTSVQARRFHQIRFAIAAVTLAWCVVMLAISAGEGERINGPVDWALMAGLVVLTTYMARVASRRWRRLREAVALSYAPRRGKRRSRG